VSEAEASELRRFARGVAEFNAGHFYEAHETWESIWVEEVGEQRLSLQALVQVAAGCHKAEIGVPGGARKLWTSALRILEGASADAWGIDVVKLRSDLRRALDEPTAGSFRIETPGR
jgi:uncharacterized protein